LRGWLRRRLDVVLFALGCAVLVFLAGMVAGQAKLFPYAQLHAASEAWDDWRENWRHYLIRLPRIHETVAHG
jgi:hypothetical protein